MENSAQSVTLYFKSGASDKIYTARIDHATDGGFLVNYEYGRRGAALSTGTKTKTPVDHPTALRLFEKLVAEKQSKGYSPGADGTPYLHSDNADKVSGLLPQLLNVIDTHQARQLVDDPRWAMQEKLDGRRLMIRKAGDSVEGINKLGLIVSIAAPIADAVHALPGDMVLDGEAIDDHFHAFDLLSLDGADLRGKACADRYRTLTALIDNADTSPHLRYVDCWTSAADKSEQLAALKAANAEGAVFKHWDAPYTQGRPNSGGTQLKLKFVATVSAVVTKVNQQRSVGVSLLNDGHWQPVGNVTVPANQQTPQLGDVVEIQYLYAHDGGALTQPVLLGFRTDVEPTECVTTQLRYKPS